MTDGNLIRLNPEVRREQHMPPMVIPAGQMRNTPRMPPNRDMRRDAATAFAAIQYADVWREGETIADTDTVRVDVQGATTNPPGVNLQAQLNGVRSNSTIATALVEQQVRTSAGNNGADQATALQLIQNALTQSLNTLMANNPTQFAVRGTFP
jgi:hypothetical protein